jgi:hypothetical protein
MVFLLSQLICFQGEPCEVETTDRGKEIQHAGGTFFDPGQKKVIWRHDRIKEVQNPKSKIQKGVVGMGRLVRAIQNPKSKIQKGEKSRSIHEWDPKSRN